MGSDVSPPSVPSSLTPTSLRTSEGQGGVSAGEAAGGPGPLQPRLQTAGGGQAAVEGKGSGARRLQRLGLG